jgi:hypothetical protein
VRVSPSEKGWKGVNVGVAFAGAVIRNRLAGVAAGSKLPVIFPLGAAQPVIKIMRIAVRSVRLMPFLLIAGGLASRYLAWTIGTMPPLLGLKQQR